MKPLIFSIACMMLVAGDTPRPLSVEDKAAILMLQVDAHKALERKLDAERARAQADLAYDRAQRDLDAANAAIAGKTKELRDKYNAEEKLWDVAPDFTWVPAKVRGQAQ